MNLFSSDLLYFTKMEILKSPLVVVRTWTGLRAAERWQCQRWCCRWPACRADLGAGGDLAPHLRSQDARGTAARRSGHEVDTQVRHRCFRPRAGCGQRTHVGGAPKQTDQTTCRASGKKAVVGAELRVEELYVEEGRSRALFHCVLSFSQRGVL